MTQQEKEGFVFQCLRQSASFPDIDLLQALPAEPNDMVSWIIGRKPMNDYRLDKALRLLGSDRESFDFLCKTVAFD